MRFLADLTLTVGFAAAFVAPLVIGEGLVRLYCWLAGVEFRE